MVRIASGAWSITVAAVPNSPSKPTATRRADLRTTGMILCADQWLHSGPSALRCRGPTRSAFTQCRRCKFSTT
jgi:hypothetical protein